MAWGLITITAVICLSISLGNSSSLGVGRWQWVGGSEKVEAIGEWHDAATFNASSPGSRMSMVYFSDHRSKLYMGFGFGWGHENMDGEMLDLWEYDTTATSFPWKKLLGNTHSGAPSDVKDTMKGIPSATITPHSSAGPGFCVDVMHNTLWMFGGMHSPVAVKMRRTNALWKYEMNSGEWTWVSGDANAAVPSGKIPSAAGQGGKSFFPGARSNSALWCDSKNQKLYLYGGIGFNSFTLGRLNDFWEFDIPTNEWTLLSEPPVVLNSPPQYEGDTLSPGSRSGVTYWFDEVNENLFMFGGMTSRNVSAVSQAGRSTSDPSMNDLWTWNTRNKKWSILGGSKEGAQKLARYLSSPKDPAWPASVYGASSALVPDSRLVLIRGGIGATNNTRDDMWVFNMDTTSWTFVDGAMTTVELPAIFVAQPTGGPKPSKKRVYPGSRAMSALWVTKNSNDTLIWMFGGLRRGDGGKATSNDMWTAPLLFGSSIQSPSKSNTTSSGTLSSLLSWELNKIAGAAVLTIVFAALWFIWRRLPKPKQPKSNINKKKNQ